MSKTKHLFLLILSFWVAATASLHAQTTDFDNYQTLQTTGGLPADLTTPSSTKYKAEAATISKKTKKKERVTKDKFYLESNFKMDDMLQSGFVLYNDPIGKYIGEVADKILKDNKPLREKLRFYVLRTPTVNAFATNQGMIFVTMGMLAQLENEAQLAFTLSHEIVHYEKKHALNFYLKSDDIDREASQKSVLRNSTFNRDLFRKTFSKELETEADSLGMERFLKLDYDLESVDGLFDVLKYSELPFDEVKFEKSFFEDTYLKFPAAYQREKIRPIAGRDEAESDSLSTHPNIAKRRAAVERRLAKASNDGRKKFPLGESRFAEMQKIARFEQPLLQLHAEYFYNGIYDAYMLLKQEPNSLYLQKCVGKALYTSSKYRNADNKYDEEIDSLQGEFQGVAHFMEKLQPSELNALAVNYNWKLHKAYPKDEELKVIAYDALTELVQHHFNDTKLLARSLKAAEPPKVAELTPKKADAKPKRKGKYAKIDEQAAEKKVEKTAENGVTTDSSNIAKYAFIDWLKDKEFSAQLAQAKMWADKNIARIAYYKSDKGRRATEKEQELKEKRGTRLGYDKIVVVNPYYQRIKRDQSGSDFIASEAAQTALKTCIADNAARVGLSATILDVSGIKGEDAEKFNEIALLNDWFSEQIDFSDLSITPGHHQKEINAIAKKYGTKYFCWTGVVAIHQPISGNNGQPIVLVSPLKIVKWLATPKGESITYCVVYNVETGESKLVKYLYSDIKDDAHFLNAQYYDIFLQIKSKSKANSKDKISEVAPQPAETEAATPEETVKPAEKVKSTAPAKPAETIKPATTAKPTVTTKPAPKPKSIVKPKK